MEFYLFKEVALRYPLKHFEKVAGGENFHIGEGAFQFEEVAIAGNEEVCFALAGKVHEDGVLWVSEIFYRREWIGKGEYLGIGMKIGQRQFPSAWRQTFLEFRAGQDILKFRQYLPACDRSKPFRDPKRGKARQASMSEHKRGDIAIRVQNRTHSPHFPSVSVARCPSSRISSRAACTS